MVDTGITLPLLYFVSKPFHYAKIFHAYTKALFCVLVLLLIKWEK